MGSTRRPARIEGLVLATIVTVAVFWRFYELDYRSLWYDEVAVARVAAQDDLSAVVQGAQAHMSAPPIDYVLRHYWQNSFGVGDNSLRAYSAIWGCLAIVLVYLLGRSVFGSAVGLLAALLIAVSDYHVHYSAEVKFYAVSVVMYLAILYAWTMAMRDSYRWRMVAVFGFVSVLGVYTHPYASFAIGFCTITSAFQLVMCMYRERSIQSCVRSLRLVVAAIAAIVVYVPWVIWDFLQQPDGWTAPEISFLTARAILDELVPAGNIGLTVVIIGCAYFVVMTVVRKHHGHFARQVPIWLTVLIAPLLVWILDVIGHYPFLSKQLVFVQPMLLILAAAGLLDLHETLHRRVNIRWGATKVTVVDLGAAIVMIVILGLSSAELSQEKRPESWLLFNYRQVVGWIQEHKGAKDLVVWTEKDRSHAVEWYLEQMGLAKQSVGLVRTWERTSANIDNIQGVVKKHSRGEVWLFGPEIDQVFDSYKIANLLHETTIGNVRIFRIRHPQAWNHELVPPLISAQMAKHGFKKPVFLLSDSVYKLEYVLADTSALDCGLELASEANSAAHNPVTVSPDNDMLLLDSDPASAGEYTITLHSTCLHLVETASLVRVPAVGADTSTRIDDGSLVPAGAAQHEVDDRGRTQTWLYKSGDAVTTTLYVRVPGRYQVAVYGTTYGTAPTTASIFINRMFMGELDFGEDWTSAEVYADFPEMGTYTLQLVFANDNGQRDLAIDWVEFAYVSSDFEPLVTLDLESLVVTYHGGVGLSSSGELGMFWAGRAVAEYAVEPGLYTLRVLAQGQQGCQLWPVLKIDVNGTEVANRAIDSSSTQVYEFPNVSFSGGDKHVLGLRFEQPGECNEPGQDVNLFIQGVYLLRTGDAPVIAPTPVPTPTATPDWGAKLNLDQMAQGYRGGVELSSSGELGMYWAGRAAAEYAVEPGLYTLRIEARGQQGCQLWPVLRVDVDGTEVAIQSVESSSTQVYEFPGVSFAGGDMHVLGLRFEQPGECNTPGQDVNLFIHGVYLLRTGDIPVPTPTPAGTPAIGATPPSEETPVPKSDVRLRPVPLAVDYHGWNS